MTNQSPSWMRSLARKAASSSTSSSASTAASWMSAVSTSAVSASATTSTSATTSSAAATCPTASSVSTGTSACSTTSTPCPRSAGWSAETSEVHCSDTLITHFLILEGWCYLLVLLRSVLLPEGEGDQPVDQLVESPYVHHDSCDEEDDDAGISHQLVPGRTNDLAELVQYLADEQGDRREEPAHRVAPPGGITARSTGAGGARRARHRHSSSLLMVPGDSRAAAPEPPDISAVSNVLSESLSVLTVGSKKYAGQEGLEPPTAGFGDRCSTN